MNRRLGCLTNGGLLAAAVTLVLLLGFYVARGGMMFSPGPLNAQAGTEALGHDPLTPVRSHAETGGQCSACHTAPWSNITLADRCQACHSSVKNELATNLGLHAQLKGQAISFDCRGCHPEHRGAAADLTQIRPDSFPHEATGYELTGHRRMADGREFACGDCHVATVTEFASSTCTDCHRQLDEEYIAVHLADFGPACLGCHDGVDRYGRNRFDHNALGFPLEGKHREVACRECHRGATSAADLATSKGECVDCHEDDDDHQGRFGRDCATCHNPNSWPDAQFDHSQTAFPLTGKHQGVTCQDCHVGGRFIGISTECSACHEDPVFHRAAFTTQCAECHTTAGWQPASFNQRHTFPINHGESGPSSCRTCHPDNVSSYTCYGCHEHMPQEIMDKHEGEVAGDISDCVRCHPTGQEDEAEED